MTVVDALLALLALNLLIMGGVLVYVVTQRAAALPANPAARLTWQRGAGICVALVLAALFLWRVRDVLTPFLVAFFLATLLDPVVTNLERRGVSRGRAVGSLFALVFAGIVLACIIIVPRARDQMEALADNAQAYYYEVTTKADALWTQYHPTLVRWHIDIKRPSSYLKSANGPHFADVTRNALESIRPALMGLASRAIWLIILPLSLYFLLLDYQRLRTKAISFFPARSQANVDRMSQEIVNIFSLYFRNLAKVCVLYGITAAILFYWLGLRHALFIGIAAGIFYAVPYAGPALTTLTCGIIALTMNPVNLYPTSIVLPSTVYALLVVGCYGVMHVTFDYVITPRLVGGSVGLHPLVNVFALMCGATMFGAVGMVLAVPVAASIQMLLVYFFPKLAEQPPVPTAELLSTTAPPEALADLTAREPVATVAK